jgi:NAD-dependent dihydropyrimidine dehydrogenase PreA subunit
MTFIIGDPCIDVMDRACVEECPVDCIYQGDRKMYVNPEECIDCGACETVCPVDAITADRRTPEERAQHIADNSDFFHTILPGRTEPLGNPGGASALGPVGVDTPLVASLAGA